MAGPGARALRRAARRPAAIEAILEAGAEKARAIAAPTLADVREAMGVGPAGGPSAPPLSLPPCRRGSRQLELDLDVFAGPFDLLLSLILREELDLLEVELAEVVLAYLDHLEARDELDLEAATEFLVLIAALLELKSRLMLPGEEVEELDELAPAEAAEELLERMLAVRALPRRRRHLAERARARPGVPATAPRRCRTRCAGCRWPTPRRRTTRPSSAPRSAALLRTPPPIDLAHMAMPRVTRGRAPGASCATLLRRGDVLVRRGGRGRRPRDRLRDACSRCSSSTSAARPRWEQAEPFGPITVHAARRMSRRVSLRAPSRRCCSSRPSRSRSRSCADALQAAEEAVSSGARPSSRTACDGRGVVLRARRPAAGARLAPGRRGGRAAAARRARARRRSRPPRPRRWRSSPTCSRSRAPRSRASAASPRSPPPSALVERGLIEEAGRSPVRRRPLPHHAAVPEAVRAATRPRSCPTSRSGTRRPEEARRRCAIACCARARRALGAPWARTWPRRAARRRRRCRGRG